MRPLSAHKRNTRSAYEEAAHEEGERLRSSHLVHVGARLASTHCEKRVRKYRVRRSDIQSFVRIKHEGQRGHQEYVNREYNK